MTSDEQRKLLTSFSAFVVLVSLTVLMAMECAPNESGNEDPTNQECVEKYLAEMIGTSNTKYFDVKFLSSSENPDREIYTYSWDGVDYMLTYVTADEGCSDEVYIWISNASQNFSRGSPPYCFIDQVADHYGISISQVDEFKYVEYLRNKGFRYYYHTTHNKEGSFYIDPIDCSVTGFIVEDDIAGI